MMAVLLAGVLLAVLNQTLLSPALPAIMRDVQVDATTVQWLTSGYSLVEAVVIPLAAFLIGRFTTRQLFIASIGVFSLGSLTAALAPNFWFILLGRVLQAAATGAAMPMVTTVILLIFPRETRGTAMGIIGLIIGFAPAVGPSVAGLMVDTIGWRWLFGIVTILGVLVVLLACFLLKNYGSFNRTAFDVPSVILSSIGLVCLLYALSTFSSSENVALTCALAVVGIVVIGLFVRRQLSLPEPMLNVGVLRTRNYRIAVIVIGLVQAALVGTGVITPLYIQSVRGYSATMSGLAMLPGAVAGALLGLVAGRLFDRFGVRRVVLPGAAVALVGGYSLVLLGMDTDFVFIALAYTALMAGLQFTMTPLNTWGVNSLPNDVLQHAQSLSNTMNQVAASVGTALLVSISALSSVAAPDAAPLEQSYIGDHMAFCATASLLTLAVLVLVFFVRDRKQTAAAGAEGKGELTDYAAGFSGVTVDASEGERIGGDRALRVSDVMNRNPAVVRDADTMGSVMLAMAREDTSGMPVVDAAGRIEGFITDGDVASYLGREDLSFFDGSMNYYRLDDDTAFKDRLAELKQLDVMALATKRVISVAPDDELDEACRVLGEKRIKKVPVVDSDGKLVGAISRRDIVAALCEGVD